MSNLYSFFTQSLRYGEKASAKPLFSAEIDHRVSSLFKKTIQIVQENLGTFLNYFFAPAGYQEWAVVGSLICCCVDLSGRLVAGLQHQGQATRLTFCFHSAYYLGRNNDFGTTKKI